MAPILPVRLTEPSLELRLLHQRDVEEVEYQKRSGPYAVRQRQQGEGFTEEDEDHSRDHGVANEAIRAAEDEGPGRVPGRQGTRPLGREAPQRGEEEKQAYDEKSEADELESHLRGRPAECESHGVSLRDPDRYENVDRDGKDHDRKKMSKQLVHF